jgi:hypothetical protein
LGAPIGGIEGAPVPGAAGAEAGEGGGISLLFCAIEKNCRVRKMPAIAAVLIKWVDLIFLFCVESKYMVYV